MPGICTYACSGTAVSWEEFCKINLEQNGKRARSGIPCVPHFPVGWDPSPRIQNPVPWCSYPDISYTPPCDGEQLITAVKEFKQWMSDHQAECVPGHMLVFAWNEFEEGAWICPTLGPDKQPDFQRRNAFAEAAKLLHS